jgi:hypothetical protein
MVAPLFFLRSRATPPDPLRTPGMTHFKLSILLVLSLFGATATGCAIDDPETQETTVEEDSDAAELARDFSFDDLNDVSNEPVEGTIQAAVACHPGAVGETRWLNSGCCISRQRQVRHRCDGRYWRPLVGQSNQRCLASSCAV